MSESAYLNAFLTTNDAVRYYHISTCSITTYGKS